MCRGWLFPRCADRLPARSRNPAASPAGCRSWTTASPVLYEWILSLFECLPPSPNVFQKRSGKTPKKAFLPTYTDSLTTSLHAMQFSQVHFFHTIDDFTGFCQIPFNSLFFLSRRISSASCQGWPALLPVPVCTTAPTSDAVSPLVHMVEADITAPELKPCSQSVTAICGNGKIFSLSLLTVLQTVTEDSQLPSCDPTALRNHRMSGLHTRI